MSVKKIREEVVNTLLARLLTRMDLDAVPETIEVGGRPDVLVILDGVRVVVEGRFSRTRLGEDIRQRVKSGLADIALGVVYPKDLHEAGTPQAIEARLAESRFSPVFLAYFGRDGLCIQEQDSHDLRGLAETLRTVHRLQVRDELVRDHVLRVDLAIQAALDAALGHGVKPSRPLLLKIRQILGTGRSPAQVGEEDLEEMLRIAIFVLFDAMIFQDSVAAHHASVPQLKVDSSRQLSLLKTAWKKVLEVDYAPVFQVACELLDVLPNRHETNRWLANLTNVASEVVGSGILAKHDFMGRVFHKLLLRTTGAAYATYYTAVPSAWLLARLALPGGEATPDLNRLRILDPACGSGTLLSAAYLALRDHWLLSGREPAAMLDSFHKRLLEKVIHGWDVLWYAAHLSLTTLALHHQEADFEDSNIFTVPAGVIGRTVHLGSLDLLQTQGLFRGWGFSERAERTSLAGRQAEDITVEDHDLVIMNPPFSRSSNPKKKFEYVSPADSVRMTAKLTKLTKDLGLQGIGPAGLGAYFVVLALDLLKDDGRLAFVLPRSMLSGVSWKKIHKLIEKECEVEFIISNHDPGDAASNIEPWNWSEHTDIAEIMAVVRKTAKRPSERRATFVNLWRKPANEFEALALSRQILRSAGEDEAQLVLARRQVGWIWKVAQDRMARWNWLAPCVFASLDVAKLTADLRWLDESRWTALSGLCTSTGLDISPVKGYFKKADARSPYRMLWGHTSSMNTITLPDDFLGCGAPKKISSAAAHGRYASRFLLAERPHLRTGCVFAARTREPVLTSAFWELRFRDEENEPLFALWFNSTPGILLTLASSTSSQGEIFKLKVDQMTELPVIRPENVDRMACRRLFDRVSTVPFLPGPAEWLRAARREGPRYEIDEFFQPLLPAGIEFQQYYEVLAREPIFTNERL